MVSFKYASQLYKIFSSQRTFLNDVFYNRHINRASIVNFSSSSDQLNTSVKDKTKERKCDNKNEPRNTSYYKGSVTTIENTKTNKYLALRTHNCGELRFNNINEKVTLCGWVQYFRVGGKFIVLRDAYGTTQIVFPDQVIKEEWNLNKLTLESVISVTGTVKLRPNGQNNKNMSTGDIEIIVEDFKLLNLAKQLPFTIRDFNKAKESLRMQYRYLDIRFPEMQSTLRLRSTMLKEMRNFLSDNCGFVEVETPTLFKKTPGGAQEYIVPSRIPGCCYTLVQSPQQFKQLLMVGGIDRYFQIARCYRDETSRPDRQPEFTQLDIEMSFSNQKGIMNLSEELIKYVWRKTIEANLSNDAFPIITYNEAMNNYGSDKPDTRFDMKIQVLTNVLKPLANICSNTLHNALTDSDKIFAALIIENGQKVWGSNGSISRQISQQRETIDKSLESKTWLRGIRLENDNSWPDIGESEQFINELKLILSPKSKSGDVIWLAAGPKKEMLTILGRLRLIGVNEYERLTGINVRSKGPNFLWIVDFPLFEPNEDIPDKLSPAHHPFTQAHPDDEHLIFTDPLNVRGQHYDLVLDGWEIGGGSVRIHNAEIQRKVLNDILKVDHNTLNHMIEALDSGCPPHAGIAFGIDRLVAVACGAASIRDVIAFPKALGGKDLMSGAPVPITPEDQLLYHINCKK